MTPEQTKRLDAILAHCRGIVEAAEKATETPWESTTTQYQQAGYPYAIIHYDDKPSGNDIISAHVRSGEDARFIATSCNASVAMAKTTIATIERCLPLWQICVWLDFLERILTAWKEAELC